MKQRVSVGEGNPLIPRSTVVTDSSDDAKSAKRQIEPLPRGLGLVLFERQLMLLFSLFHSFNSNHRIPSRCALPKTLVRSITD